MSNIEKYYQIKHDLDFCESSFENEIKNPIINFINELQERGELF